MLIRFPKHLTSKEAIVKMQNDEHSTMWFLLADERGNDIVLAVDGLPLNYPPFEVAIFETVEEAWKRKEEMVLKEGWEIIEDELEEFIKKPGDMK